MKNKTEKDLTNFLAKSLVKPTYREGVFSVVPIGGESSYFKVVNENDEQVCICSSEQNANAICHALSVVDCINN